MKRVLALLLLLIIAAPAQAADNYTATQGSGKTFGCLDISTVCFPKFIIYDTTGAALFASGNGGYVRLASGQVASGAYASGSIADGASVNIGALADAAWSGSGNGTLTAVLKAIYGAAITGTTTTGSAVPSSAIYVGVNVAGNLVGLTPGTAGSAGTQVWSVQGIASMTPLLTNPGTIATWGLMSGTTPGTAPTNTQIVGGIYNSTAPTLTTGQTAPLQVGPRGGLLIGGAGYPIGATPITASATGTTAATTATLATGASVTTYICGFSIRANATAAATGNATVTGTITGTLNYTQWTAPTASGLGVAEQIFTPCIPASAVNTGIAVVSAAPGTGGVVSVTAWGFTL